MDRTTTTSPAVMYARVFGIVLTLVGILGLLVNPEQDVVEPGGDHVAVPILLVGHPPLGVLERDGHSGGGADAGMISALGAGPDGWSPWARANMAPAR